jgi:DNA-binding NtrC family response regulator
MGRAWKHTVLVVEDDQLQRELVSLIFEESDMHVIQCMSGEAAVVVLEKAGPELTMMFTDVDLEGEMSGIELAIIAKRRVPDIDVIVTSGQEVGEIPDDVLFMQKPWLPLELLREAERSCRRHGVH